MTLSYTIHDDTKWQISATIKTVEISVSVLECWNFHMILYSNCFILTKPQNFARLLKNVTVCEKSILQNDDIIGNYYNTAYAQLDFDDNLTARSHVFDITILK